MPDHENHKWSLRVYKPSKFSFKEDIYGLLLHLYDIHDSLDPLHEPSVKNLFSKKPNFLDIQASKRFSLAIETHRNQILSKITFVYIFVKAILLSTLTYISTCDLMRKSLHYFLVKITFLTCHNLSKTKTKSLFKTNIRSLLKD